jgi:hypothetical protein
MESSGRRWVFGAYGEVNWVRNLRARGGGILDVHGRPQHIRVVQLGPAQASVFFSEVVGPYVRRLPLAHRLFVRWLLRDILADPVSAGGTHPVFEVRPAHP